MTEPEEVEIVHIPGSPTVEEREKRLDDMVKAMLTNKWTLDLNVPTIR